MSKKVKQVEVVDDDLLKLLIDKISNLQLQITVLQGQVQMLEVKGQYAEVFNRKLDAMGVSQ